MDLVAQPEKPHSNIDIPTSPYPPGAEVRADPQAGQWTRGSVAMSGKFNA